jgi:hypothetical protein
MGGPYCLIPKGSEVRLIKDGITVTGWPRRPISSDEQVKNGQASFVFDGQTVTLKDGKYLVTLNGWFEQPLAQEWIPGLGPCTRSEGAGENEYCCS